MGDFYASCSQCFPQSHGFWIHLAEEDYPHVDAIDRRAKAVAEKPGDFEPGKVSPIEALQTCITQVSSSLTALKNGGLKKSNALLQAHLISEQVKRSVEWLTKRLTKVGGRVSYEARRWYVHVASAFPLVRHYRAVVG